MPFLHGFTLLLLCQCAGEVLARALALPLPGPVVGLLVLLLALNMTALRAPVEHAAGALLAHLSLLFVPVGVGVISHLGPLARHGAWLAVVLVASTWIGMAVAALVLQRLWRDEPGGP